MKILEVLTEGDLLKLTAEREPGEKVTIKVNGVELVVNSWQEVVEPEIPAPVTLDGVIGGRVVILDVEVPDAVLQHDGKYALDLSQVDLAETRTVTNSKGQEVTLNIEEPAQKAKFSDGIYYMLPVDVENEDIIIEEGRIHRKVFVAKPGTGYTKERIATELNLPVTTITDKWLLANPVWGGTKEKALDQSIAMPLWKLLTYKKVQSHWLLLECGGEYGLTGYHWWAEGTRGESAIHPVLVTKWGEGADPILLTALATFGCSNVAIIGVQTTLNSRLLYGDNMLISDVAPLPGSHENTITAGQGSLGIYRALIANAHRKVPGGNNPDLWANHASRVQGIYVSDSKSVLIKDTMIDYNGWRRGYSTVDASFAVSDKQPPSMYSQGVYIHDGQKDITITRSLTSRPAAGGIQLRCGGLIDNTIFLDNQYSGNDLGGDYGGKGPVGYWGTFLRNIITSASYMSEAPNAGPRGAKNWGMDFQNNLGSAVDNVVLHMANPNDPAEMAYKANRKHGIRNQTVRGFLFNNTIIVNWDVVDFNVEGLDKQKIMETTIQNFAKTVLPADIEPTIHNFCDWMQLRSGRERQLIMRDMRKYLRDPFYDNLEMSAVEPGIEVPAIFRPDYRTDGTRADIELNWSTGYLPKNGQLVKLHGNYVQWGNETIEAPIDFGGGILDVTSGKFTATEQTGQASVRVREYGQYSAPDGADGNYLAVAGRLDFRGKATVDLEVGGDAECLLGPDLTIREDGELTIYGGNAYVGWDGTGTAKLKGAIAFVAVDGMLGQLKTFPRRGNDPKPTVDVDVEITALRIDTTGVAPGTYNLGGGVGTGVTYRISDSVTLLEGVVLKDGNLSVTV